MRHIKNYKIFESNSNIEDVMWYLTDLFDKFGMTQKENLNISWDRNNEAYFYEEFRLNGIPLGENEYNIWRYNNNNEIIIICPLRQDSYKVWHSIIPYMKNAENRVESGLDIKLKVDYFVYGIGLIKIEIK